MRYEMLRMRWGKSKFRAEYLKRLFVIGLPAGLQGAVFSIANVFIQSSVNSFGDAAMAGSGDAQNFEMYIYCFTSGLANATVSFKLGGAGGGIRFIDGNGKILAQFANTKFAGREGKLNQFYYVFDNAEDIADCKAVIYDYNVSGSWNVVSADSIVTYYKSVNDVPKGATLAVNTYADKTAINAAIESAEALGVLEQGDYTIESYDDFVDALTDAKNLCNDDFATVERVNAATAALTAAQSALALREPSVKTGAEKNLVIEPSGSKEITVSDYFDENGLSSITYDITTQSDKIALSEISEGKFTITAGSDTAEGVTVTMVIKYKDAEKASVTLNITVTNAVLAPEITHENVDHAETVDLFAINSTPKSVVLDLTANVIRNGNTTLKYTVNVGDGAESAEIATPDEYSFEIPRGRVRFDSDARRDHRENRIRGDGWQRHAYLHVYVERYRHFCIQSSQRRIRNGRYKRLDGRAE